jgi:hypothetical protein
MGLFDNLKKPKEGEMTPIKAVAISMAYIIGSDGEIGPEEVGQLLSMLGGKSTSSGIVVGGQSKGFVEECFSYAKVNDVVEFIKASDTVLTDSMKMYVLMNQIDSSLSDGNPDKLEQELIGKFVSGWSIDQTRLIPVFEIISFKNDRTVFLDVESPKNKEGFTFKVSI